MNYGTRSYRFELARKYEIETKTFYDGRNCKLLIEICGTRHPRSHMIVDLGLLDEHVNKILNNFDHKTITGSFELTAKKIWEAVRLNERLARKIRLYENNKVWYDVGDNKYMDISKAYTFSAAHRTNNDDLILEENLEMYGKCNTLHGHEYRLITTVRGTLDPVRGTVIDQEFMDDTILDLLATVRNKVLNDVIKENATTENFIRFLWEELVDSFDGDTFKLHRLRLHETERNYFDYYGDQS